MARRILAVLTCLLVVFAAGCDFFAIPSSTSATTAPAVTTDAPMETPSAEASETASDSASPDATASTGAPTQSPSVNPTSTPTEEPTEEPTASPNPTEGMIFPDSDTEVLLWKDLIKLNADKLALARNEIYARAGYKFTSKKYADYYEKLSWYSVDSSFSESDFSSVQVANIHLVQVAEKAIKGQLFEVSSGLKLDYDQDGDLETLTVKFTDDNHAVASIKDGSTTTTWNISGENIIKKAYLGDIDLKDGKIDLFIGEAGPSDDFQVYVSGIKHHAFLNRGDIPGAIGSNSSKNPFKPDGKGGISTLKRMDTVGTDFFVVKYKLNSSGKLVFSPFASYNFISFSSSKYMVKTKVAIQLMKKASSTSAVLLTIPAGTQVQLVSTDASKWVKIKAPGGTGWLELAQPLKLKNPNISTWDAFDGLVMAD